MFKLYYKTDGDSTERIAEKLDAMVVAHKLIKVDNKTSMPEGISREDLPVLCDEHEVWKSTREIVQFLDELYQRLSIGRGMQSDACHIDPENPDECL